MMAQIDALALVEQLRQRLVDFGLAENFVRGLELPEILRRIWDGCPEEGGLVSDLYVQAAFPSKPSDVTLADLVARDEFSRQLAAQLNDPSRVPSDRLLHDHQAKTLRRAREASGSAAQPAILVAAETGAGKTESFLLPMLNRLATEDRPAGTQGIRALILYPMNALVQDQVDRLYTWLKGQSSLRIFHFTGETPEDAEKADRDGVPLWEDCRVRTRQQARGLEDQFGRPLSGDAVAPEIVITNYSMLEYMLCRPQDDIFFDGALQCFILDEAHFYTGALAGEITLLQRRLLNRCGLTSTDILHLASSATMGGTEQDLREFVGTLFSKPPEHVHVVQGTPAQTLPDVAEAPPEVAPSCHEIAEGKILTEATIELDNNGDQCLVQNELVCDELSQRLRQLVGSDAVESARASAGDVPAHLLYFALAQAPLIRQLGALLWDNPRRRLQALAAELWSGDASPPALAATIELLRLAAAARQDIHSQPLVPHRLHVLTRLPAEMRACLNPDCDGPEDRRWDGLGIVAESGAEQCPHCNRRMLPIQRCSNCGEICLLAWQTGDRLVPQQPPAADARPADDGDASSTDGNRLALWPPQRAATGQSDDGPVLVVDPATGQIGGADSKGLPLKPLECCPNCGEGHGTWQTIGGTSRIGLPLIAETLLAALPEYPSSNRIWLPGRGRRLLTFSDSRREAALLGPQLSQEHERRMIRAALVRALTPVDEHVIADLQADLDRVNQRLQSEGLSDQQRLRLEIEKQRLQQDLSTAWSGGNTAHWAQRIADSEPIRQLLDRDTAELHGRSPWTQEKFEENAANVRSSLATWIMSDLIVPRRDSGTPEDLGLLEVVYPGLGACSPPSELLGTLPDENARQALLQCWPDFLAALCDMLREQGAVTLGTRELDRDYGSEHVQWLGLWCSEQHVRQGQLIRFVGESPYQKRRRFAAQIVARLGIVEEELQDDETQCSQQLLRAAFQSLLQLAQGDDHPWLEHDQRQTAEGLAVDALRIRFPELSLRSPQSPFLCPRTGWVWPRSVLGCAPCTGCTDLQPATHEDLDNASRFSGPRREYRESPVFSTGIWAEEHSAQLSPQENRRRQDLFKEGSRNILSSTTTLELGVDIGGLNGVLLSNVPPSNVSYMQRAGRAGRRSDGSSIVVTFARKRGFDRQVFREMDAYLGQDIRPPSVLLNRERLVLRHVHAVLLAEFFHQVRQSLDAGVASGAMQAYGRMGGFCGVPQPPYWPSGDKPVLPDVPMSPASGSPPDWWEVGDALADQFVRFLNHLAESAVPSLRDAIRTLLSGTPLADRADDANWPGLIETVQERYTRSLATWRETYDSLLRAWQNVDSSAGDARREANAIRYQAIAFLEVHVIEALGEEQFLPRYGFPIGVLRLKVINVTESDADGRRQWIREEDQYRLQREGILAMREYIPGAKFYVGNRIVTSKGLLKHWTGNDVNTSIGFRGQLYECVNEHRYYAFDVFDESQVPPCPICDRRELAENYTPKQLLFPRFGFSTAAWAPPTFQGTPSRRLGHVDLVTIVPGSSGRQDFGGIPGIDARYQEDGELLVVHHGENGEGFAVCLNCGYSVSELRRRQTRPGDVPDPLPREFETHAHLLFEPTPGGRWPHCQQPDRRHQLRHQLLTARQITDILLLDVPQLRNYDLAVATTLAHALRLAGTRLLNLDSREMGSFVMPTSGPFCGLVLYDSVPGGAGHVAELLELADVWVEAVRETLFVDESHDRRCDTACLDCLLSFETQFDHDGGRLNRRRALMVWEDLRNGRLGLTATDGQDPSPTDTTNASDQDSQPDPEARLARAAERRQRRRR